MDISLRGELWDNDSADVLRFWGWRDITAPMDIAGALERAGGAEGDYRAMRRSAEALRNARDCILEVYTARGGGKTREELVSLMDKDIWITPTQAREYGLIDEIVGAAQEPEEEPAAFVAAAGRRIRLTAAMREQYQAHVAAERAEAARQDEAARTLARLRALAGF